MGWKNWPYWVKGWVIFLIFGALLFSSNVVSSPEFIRGDSIIGYTLVC